MTTLGVYSVDYFGTIQEKDTTAIDACRTKLVGCESSHRTPLVPTFGSGFRNAFPEALESFFTGGVVDIVSFFFRFKKNKIT